jgi:hypothetical protein
VAISKRLIQLKRLKMNIPDGATYQSPENKKGVLYYKQGFDGSARVFDVQNNKWVDSQLLYWSSVKELCYKIKTPVTRAF